MRERRNSTDEVVPEGDGGCRHAHSLITNTSTKEEEEEELDVRKGVEGVEGATCCTERNPGHERPDQPA